MSQYIRCPKCGHQQEGIIECEACGIIFSKFRQHQEVRQEPPPLRTAQKPKSPPYVIIAAVVSVLLIFSVLIFVDGKDGEEVQAIAPETQTITNQATAEVETSEDARYRYYKMLTGYHLDHTLLRFQPGITNEYLDEFNYRWIQAYRCDYSSEIQQDKSRFYEVMRKVMDEELRYRYDYPVKFQHQGDLSVKLISKGDNAVSVRPYIRVRANLGGSREKTGEGCHETRSMNTGHVISFAPLRQNFTLQVPDRILSALDYPERGFELEADIKFRIEDASYEYLKSQRSFRVRHKAVIEEMAVLNNDNAPREQRIFMTFTESQLY